MYYAAHQLFLSPNTLYLAVWNVTHGEQGVESLRRWLLNIQVSHSHVLQVAFRCCKCQWRPSALSVEANCNADKTKISENKVTILGCTPRFPFQTPPTRMAASFAQVPSACYVLLSSLRYLVVQKNWFLMLIAGFSASEFVLWSGKSQKFCLSQPVAINENLFKAVNTKPWKTQSVSWSW